MFSYTRVIWTFTLLIMCMGLVTLYSAAHENVRVSHQVFFDQLWCTMLGIFLMWWLSRIDYRMFYETSYILYIINIILLIAVLWMGRSALGATRWFNVFGISFQPSELSKIAVILMLGRYFSKRAPKISFGIYGSFYILWRDLLYPLLLVLISFILIFKQPDLGSGLLIIGIFIAMLFVSSLKIKPFLFFIGSCLAMIPIGWHFLKDYQKSRLLVFLNPNIDPLGSGYTIIQSRIAVGSGQLFGKGWLAGTQNQLNFLPERHTDFIFSVIGEEWGFLGSFFVLSCFFVLIYTGLQIALRVKDRFGFFVTIGIITILTLQVTINISMTMGLSPVVGIPLPFISYGRTSFIVFAIMMGFLLNLSKKPAMYG